jgi:hypothetical protein
MQHGRGDGAAAAGPGSRRTDTSAAAVPLASLCTLLRLPPISATLKTTVRADPPPPRRQLNAAWLDKKGRLAQYIGMPGPFAQTCKVMRALFPLHIGEYCQSSWQGDLLTPLDCALVAKMWLHTGKTMGLLATRGRA